jgi:hypothetical protein
MYLHKPFLWGDSHPRKRSSILPTIKTILFYTGIGVVLTSLMFPLLQLLLERVGP